MKILKKEFGGYQTNCYILSFDKSNEYSNKNGNENINNDNKNTQNNSESFEFIIDPGYGAMPWIVQNCKNPKAILLTHGHYDHIWDVKVLKDHYKNIQIYCPIQDSFMLETDCFDLNINTCTPDIKIENEKSTKELNINGIKVTYFHFPGHTPGCSIIEIEDHIFSGDFVFKRSIGRSDLPFSNDYDMKDSLIRFANLKSDTNKVVHPGHGEDTLLKEEQKSMDVWISRFD